MGKGGDILFRWGNPQNYDVGSAEDRTLYYQHNPNWIKYGPNKGKLICYNNGLDRPVPSFRDRYSSIEIFDPAIDDSGQYVYDDELGYTEKEAKVALDKFSVDLDFFSDYQSGTQVLPNGHILITIYEEGRILEVDLDGNILWEYGAAQLFRSERYPLDYPAFEGRDLSPKGQVWNTNYDCQLYTSSTENVTEPEVASLYPNPASNYLYLAQTSDRSIARIFMKDLMGKTVLDKTISEELEVHHLEEGLYVCELYDAQFRLVSTEKVVIAR